MREPWHEILLTHNGVFMIAQRLLQGATYVTIGLEPYII